MIGELRQTCSQRIKGPGVGKIVEGQNYNTKNIDLSINIQFKGHIHFFFFKGMHQIF